MQWKIREKTADQLQRGMHSAPAEPIIPGINLRAASAALLPSYPTFLRRDPFKVEIEFFHFFNVEWRGKKYSTAFRSEMAKTSSVLEWCEGKGNITVCTPIWFFFYSNFYRAWPVCLHMFFMSALLLPACLLVCKVIRPTVQLSVLLFDLQPTCLLPCLSYCGTASLQRYYTENSKNIFPEMELRGHCPNSYNHVSVCDLHIPTIGLHILLQ